jgi:hypothetical protein
MMLCDENGEFHKDAKLPPIKIIMPGVYRIFLGP